MHNTDDPSGQTDAPYREDLVNTIGHANSNPSEGERAESVEPWEEGENTRGFQNGSWDYKNNEEGGTGAGDPYTDRSQLDPNDEP